MVTCHMHAKYGNKRSHLWSWSKMTVLLESINVHITIIGRSTKLLLETEHQYAAYSYINLYSRAAVITVQYYVSMCLNVLAVICCVTGIIGEHYIC